MLVVCIYAVVCLASPWRVRGWRILANLNDELTDSPSKGRSAEEDEFEEGERTRETDQLMRDWRKLERLNFDNPSGVWRFCIGRDLSASDKSITLNGTSRVANDWVALFEAWNGKRVLLGGDSLADQIFQVIGCAADLLGTAEHSNVMKFHWSSSGKSVEARPYTVQEHIDQKSKLNTNTSFLVFRLKARVGPYSFVLDYMRIYTFTSLCQACSRKEDRASCGLCPRDSAFAARFDTVADWAAGYDHVFLNMGHDVLYGAPETRLKVDALISAFQARKIADRLVLLEHPPRHYATSDGTGNWEGHSNQPCRHDLPHISKQTISLQNREMAEAAEARGVRVAQMFNHFKHKRGAHPGHDCTHYFVSPTLWRHAVSSLLK